MEMNQIAKNALQYFCDYCKEKKIQVEKTENSSKDVRLEISNSHERTQVIIYHTGKIVPGGKKNNLRNEFEELKTKFQSGKVDASSEEKTKACTVKYDILLKELREKIKESLKQTGITLEIANKPTSTIEYIAKISKGSKNLTLTQFNNGTLCIQGKEDDFLHEICDIVEQVANPAEKDVIARFISGDEETLKIFVAKCTPEILELAEKNIKKKLGQVYDFLEPYDQKWFVAAECLCLAKVPLPEFSPIVMPASKAFEGFVKKLLVGIGLYDPGYFKTENYNFGVLNDDKNPKRIAVCAKDKNVNTMLKKIDVCIKTNRHFMMHSDESKITKLDKHEEAEEKVKNILSDTKDFFDTFNKIFNLI